MAKNSKAGAVTEQTDEEKKLAEEAVGLEDEFADGKVNIDDENLVEEQIGFPPYLVPEEGRIVKATPIALDKRDPEFFRYVLRAGHNLRCATGPTDEAEPVLVKEGEFFTMSVYASLPLNRYMGVEVIMICKEKRQLKGPNSLWVWALKVTKDTKEALLKRAEAKRAAEIEEAKKNGLALPQNDLADIDVYALAKSEKDRVTKAVQEAKRTS